MASGLAWLDASRDAGDGPGLDRAWWIGAANMLGSVAFGVSAVAAYVVPADGDVRNAELSNLGTLVGAICFLIGAILLLPTKPAPDTARGGTRSGGLSRPAHVAPRRPRISPWTTTNTPLPARAQRRQPAASRFSSSLVLIP